MADKLSDYITAYDTSRGPGQDEQEPFYNTRPGVISYLNVPKLTEV